MGSATDLLPMETGILRDATHGRVKDLHGAKQVTSVVSHEDGRIGQHHLQEASEKLVCPADRGNGFGGAIQDRKMKGLVHENRNGPRPSMLGSHRLRGYPAKAITLTTL